MKRTAMITLLVLALASQVTTIYAQGNTPQPVVHAVMFWMRGCGHCEDVIENILPPLREKHGKQFELLMIEVVTTQDVDMLYRVAASYDISREQTGVPFLIIGDTVLMGSDQARAQLSNLINDHLASGGVDWPTNDILAEFLPAVSTTSPRTSSLPAVQEAPIAADDAPVKPINNGFTLAIIIMAGMIFALLYSMAAFVLGKSLPLPGRAEWLIPALIAAGMAVAGYLSYVETQSVSAICGPIGDCNTVQQSRYATLFGILPIGILGFLGYLALLTAWLLRRFFIRYERVASIGFFAMSFVAVIFSLYLTYLEPFVIRAVCIWCLASAVIVTLLLLLGTPGAIRQFGELNDE